MNATHAAVGVSLTAVLTTILTGFHGLNGEQAAAWAWLITMALGSGYALAKWFIGWKWPSAPPLPEDRRAA